jgi:hypothetical protein
MAILGTMPERMAPRPLYSARGPFSVVSLDSYLAKNREERTPGARPDLDSCIRTLIVLSGWHASQNGMNKGWFQILSRKSTCQRLILEQLGARRR